MPSGEILLVICLTGVIGLGVPAMIYAGLRGRGTIGQFDLMRKAAKRSQQPWQPEDTQLSELAKRVEQLKKGQRK
jgi:hypothetical protein